MVTAACWNHKAIVRLQWRLIEYEDSKLITNTLSWLLQRVCVLGIKILTTGPLQSSWQSGTNPMYSQVFLSSSLPLSFFSRRLSNAFDTFHVHISHSSIFFSSFINRIQVRWLVHPHLSFHNCAPLSRFCTHRAEFFDRFPIMWRQIGCAENYFVIGKTTLPKFNVNRNSNGEVLHPLQLSESRSVRRTLNGDYCRQAVISVLCQSPWAMLISG